MGLASTIITPSYCYPKKGLNIHEKDQVINFPFPPFPLSSFFFFSFLFSFFFSVFLLLLFPPQRGSFPREGNNFKHTQHQTQALMEEPIIMV